MALYVTVLGLVGGTPGEETASNLLVSNKPLDIAASRRRSQHDVDVLRVIHSRSS